MAQDGYVSAMGRINSLVDIVCEDELYCAEAAVSSEVFNMARQFLTLLYAYAGDDFVQPMITAGFDMVSFEWVDMRVDVGVNVVDIEALAKDVAKRKVVPVASSRNQGVIKEEEEEDEYVEGIGWMSEFKQGPAITIQELLEELRGFKEKTQEKPEELKNMKFILKHQLEKIQTCHHSSHSIYITSLFGPSSGILLQNHWGSRRIRLKV